MYYFNKDNSMYVIEGYVGGALHWYDSKKNSWGRNMFKAEFFDTILEAQFIIDEFQFNENDYIKIWQGRRYEKTSTMLNYITPKYYDDGDVAKQMLLVE